MKALKKLTASLIMIALAAAPAFAAQESSDSGLLSWLFLGFIGMIVASQLIPALVMGFGMIKGVFGHGQHNDHSHSHKHNL